jgi:hypothetical protein
VLGATGFDAPKPCVVKLAEAFVLGEPLPYRFGATLGELLVIGGVALSSATIAGIRKN